MDLVVSEETLHATKRCDRNFACLKREGAARCDVDDCAGGSVIYCQCPSDVKCCYKHMYGYGHFCQCPTRTELYEKYKT